MILEMYQYGDVGVKHPVLSQSSDISKFPGALPLRDDGRFSIIETKTVFGPGNGPV